MPNKQIQSLTVAGETYDIVDNTSGYMKGMTILSYGSSSWQDFIDAYSENKVVYCRASSQSNPATGDQTRLAFMAYVNNPSNPTSVEFQYYRSVSTHTEAQQGDQVFVYTLTSAGSWSVTTREASVKVAVGGDLTGSYSNGTYTVSGDIPSISVSQIETSGVNIADVTIDGTTTHLYAPQGGGGGSVTSVGVSNTTNGGLSVSGSPITSSGTISIGHSNVLTNAQTTQAVYPITIDKNGHIASYGSAVSIEDEVFVVTYDSTSYSDARAAFNAGKYLICLDPENGVYAPLAYESSSILGFKGVTSSSSFAAISYMINSSNEWSVSSTSISDEKVKWTSSTTSNTYYPLQSTSTASTSTANTINGVSFYQYYNTAGGYRRLDLGNSTAYKSTGGAYGTIRLYGAAATYYGDLIPGTLGTTSGDGHISANRTWTLPDKTGTVALTSDIPTVPSTAGSNTTGVSIADHATSSITGVQSSTTTASKVTLGTAISVPNVTAVGSGSFTQGAFDGGSFTQGTDSFTANTPTTINTSKFNGGSFTSGTFTAGSLTMAMDTTDTKQLNITFTAPTHGADSFTSASLASGFYTAGTAASFTQGADSFTPATHGADSHTHIVPTLGTEISVPNVTGATDVTVPIKNTSSTTVVTGKTHTITDNGHTHDLG